MNNFSISQGYSSALERIGEISKLEDSIENFGSRLEAKPKKVFSNIISELSARKFKQQFQEAINQSAKEFNLDPKLVNAVIEQESRFNPKAVSSAGAMGLMQLMPGTAQDLGVKDPLNPVENIRAGTRYLSSLLNRYQGNVVLALSAYNAGPQNVEKYKGVPPFEETRNYVKGIINRLT